MAIRRLGVITALVTLLTGLLVAVARPAAAADTWLYPDTVPVTSTVITDPANTPANRRQLLPGEAEWVNNVRDSSGPWVQLVIEKQGIGMFTIGGAGLDEAIGWYGRLKMLGTGNYRVFVWRLSDLPGGEPFDVTNGIPAHTPAPWGRTDTFTYTNTYDITGAVTTVTPTLTPVGSARADCDITYTSAPATQSVYSNLPVAQLDFTARASVLTSGRNRSPYSPGPTTDVNGDPDRQGCYYHQQANTRYGIGFTDTAGPGLAFQNVTSAQPEKWVAPAGATTWPTHATLTRNHHTTLTLDTPGELLPTIGIGAQWCPPGASVAVNNHNGNYYTVDITGTGTCRFGLRKTTNNVTTYSTIITATAAPTTPATYTAPAITVGPGDHTYYPGNQQFTVTGIDTRAHHLAWADTASTTPPVDLCSTNRTTITGTTATITNYSSDHYTPGVSHHLHVAVCSDDRTTTDPDANTYGYAPTLPLTDPDLTHAKTLTTYTNPATSTPGPETGTDTQPGTSPPTPTPHTGNGPQTVVKPTTVKRGTRTLTLSTTRGARCTITQPGTKKFAVTVTTPRKKVTLRKAAKRGQRITITCTASGHTPASRTLTIK